MPNFNVELHSGQIEVWQNQARFKVVASGRRFGKTRLLINRALVDTLSWSGPVSQVSPETVLIAMPTLSQAKAVLWRPFMSLCRDTDLALLNPEINRSEYTIGFPGKPLMVFRGANDAHGDGMRGLRLWRFFGDEYQDFAPGIFDTVIRPAMADTPGSKALFTGTPKPGKTHPFRLLSKRQLDDPEWKTFNLPTVMNPFVPTSEVEEARKTMPPRIFNQEFYASWEDLPGSIFYELSDANFTAEFTPEATFLGVDFGDVNPSFTVWGLQGDIWCNLENWNNPHQVPIAQPEQDRELIRLAEKYQPRATFCDPSRPTAILGIRALGKTHELEGLQMAVSGFNRIEEGIQQVHSLIYQRKLLFLRGNSEPDKVPGYQSPAELYDLFAGYHRHTDRAGDVTELVAPGQDDHGVDASRYCLARAKAR